MSPKTLWKLFHDDISQEGKKLMSNVVFSIIRHKQALKYKKFSKKPALEYLKQKVKDIRGVSSKYEINRFFYEHRRCKEIGKGKIDTFVASIR